MPLWTLPSRRGTSWSVPTVSSLAIGGVTITCGGTPHTKTAWTTVAASTGSAAWEGFWLYLDTVAVNATDSSMLIDIGVGVAASEVTIVANMPIGYRGGAIALNPIWIPLYIPSGTRVAARLQSAIASAALKLTTVGNNSGHGLISDNDLYGYCTTYGASLSTSHGTATTSGAVDTYGTPAEVTVPGTGLTAPMHAALICVGGNGSNAMNTTTNRLALCGGAGGSEVARTTDFYFAGTSTESINPSGLVPFTQPIEGLSVPVGERESIKVASHTATQTFDFALIAFTR